MLKFRLTELYFSSKIFGSVNFGGGHIKSVIVFFVFLVVLGIEGFSNSIGLRSIWFDLISHLTNI
jgi:hypothetical protein